MGNETDRFFREGLGPLEVTPSASSWDQVQAALKKKNRNKSTWIWRAAASILVVLVGTLLLYSPWETAPKALNSYQYAPPAGGERLALTLPQDELPKEQVRPVTAGKRVPPKRPRPRQQMRPLELVAIRTLPIADSTPVKPEHPERGLKAPPVRITYIASDTAPARDTLNETGLSKVFAYAQRLSPVELLADIRDAKNNLLNIDKN